MGGLCQHEACQGELARRWVACLEDERRVDPTEHRVIGRFAGAQIGERVFALARVRRFGTDLEQDGHVRRRRDPVEPAEPAPAAGAGYVHQRVVEIPIHDEDALPHRLDVQSVAQEDEQVDRVDEPAQPQAPDDRVAEPFQLAQEPRTPGDLVERDRPRGTIRWGARERIPDGAQDCVQADIAIHVQHGDRAVAALQLALEPGDQARFARAVESRERDQHAGFTT